MRKEIQRRRKQSEPCGKRHRVHVDGHAVGDRTPDEPRGRAKQQRLAQLDAREVLGHAFEHGQPRPMNSAGTATMKPAIGPDKTDVEQRDLARGYASGCE